ncbi:endoribonuclease YbeY [Holospora undulata HU1]|uniref:Endoribonuclease YbeY n=1 Tax=Holospora undulata HU1 TaxID=1321371 RepID=A0A061JI71_9PROT|nr:endoribonuclease YbeY [Holospora undulata HU1]
MVLFIGIFLANLNSVLHLTLNSRKDLVGYCDFLDQSFVKKIVSSVLLKAGHKAYREVYLEVLLISDEEMEYYTRCYGPEPGPTNVLSFPLLSVEENINFPKNVPLPLGSILLGFPYITQEIKEYNFLPEAHIARLLVHGTLHLLEYDHVEQKERHVMETLEANICTHLGYDWRPL